MRDAAEGSGGGGGRGRTERVWVSGLTALVLCRRRHSYRTGQDIANCGTCRDCACIIYRYETAPAPCALPLGALLSPTPQALRQAQGSCEPCPGTRGRPLAPRLRSPRLPPRAQVAGQVRSRCAVDGAHAGSAAGAGRGVQGWCGAALRGASTGASLVLCSFTPQPPSCSLWATSALIGSDEQRCGGEMSRLGEVAPCNCQAPAGDSLRASLLST